MSWYPSNRRSYNFGHRAGRDWKKIGLIIAVIVALVGSLYWYWKAYNNSAEYITITVADKYVDTRTDEDGFTSRTYKVVAQSGEVFYCSRKSVMGNARPMYNRLRVDHKYEVLVAGLGIFDRDILEISREIQPHHNRNVEAE